MTFKVDQLKSLTGSDPEQLRELEVQIQQEFRDLVRNYLENRVVKVNSMLKNIDSSIKELQQNDNQWEKVFNFENGAIDSMKSNLEHLLNGTGIKDYLQYEQEINEIITNISNPKTFDNILNESKKLEFDHFFKPSLTTSNKELEMVFNESQYQKKLINQNLEKNKNIIWLQYREKLLAEKDRLIKESLNNLNDLNKSFHREDVAKDYQQDWDHYHKSLMSISDLKNDNPNYNIYELTNIKKGILAKLADDKLSQLEGLNEMEMNNDLQMMRGEIKPVDDIDTDFQNQYNELLTSEVMELPSIPPIESFTKS